MQIWGLWLALGIYVLLFVPIMWNIGAYFVRGSGVEDLQILSLFLWKMVTQKAQRMVGKVKQSVHSVRQFVRKLFEVNTKHVSGSISGVRDWIQRLQCKTLVHTEEEKVHSKVSEE
jgi:hypothetical protein